MSERAKTRKQQLAELRFFRDALVTERDAADAAASSMAQAGRQDGVAYHEGRANGLRLAIAFMDTTLLEPHEGNPKRSGGAPGSSRVAG